jgi:hypothetical protein
LAQTAVMTSATTIQSAHEAASATATSGASRLRPFFLL